MVTMSFAIAVSYAILFVSMSMAMKIKETFSEKHKLHNPTTCYPYPCDTDLECVWKDCTYGIPKCRKYTDEACCACFDPHFQLRKFLYMPLATTGDSVTPMPIQANSNSKVASDPNSRNHLIKKSRAVIHRDVLYRRHKKRSRGQDHQSDANDMNVRCLLKMD